MNVREISIWKGEKPKEPIKKETKPPVNMKRVKVNNTYEKAIIETTDRFSYINGRKIESYETFNFVTTEYENLDPYLKRVFVKTIRDLPMDQNYYQYYDHYLKKFIPYYGIALLDNERFAPIYKIGCHTLFPFRSFTKCKRNDFGKLILEGRYDGIRYTFLENHNNNLNDLELITLYNNQIMERARKTKKSYLADYIIRIFFRLNYGQYDVIEAPITEEPKKIVIASDVKEEEGVKNTKKEKKKNKKDNKNKEEKNNKKKESKSKE